MKGFTALPIIIVTVVVLAVFFVVGSLSRDNKPPSSAPEHPQTESAGSQPNSNQGVPDLGAGVNKPFYSEGGLYLIHTWPSEGNFSAEETEILLFNESDSNVEVKSFNLEYQVEGKTYPHKSGTWEKFPTKSSWEKTEYLNISPQYYTGQPLALARGEKGKLHWHINFGPNPLDGKQIVKVKLTLLRDGQIINIDEAFNRDSGTVFTKENH